MFKDSYKHIFKNFERIKVLLKNDVKFVEKNFLNKRHLLLEETDSNDWYYSSLNSFKNTKKIIFLQILYLLSPLWCPRIQNCSLGDTNFLPLYMFMLFFTVIKNVYLCQRWIVLLLSQVLFHLWKRAKKHFYICQSRYYYYAKVDHRDISKGVGQVF